MRCRNQTICYGPAVPHIFRIIGEHKDVMAGSLVKSATLRSVHGAALTPQQLIVQMRAILEDHPGGTDDFQAQCSMTNTCVLLGYLVPAQLNRIELLESLGAELYGMELSASSVRRVRETIAEELRVLEWRLNTEWL